MPDRSPPRDSRGERQTLLACLDYLRESVALKAEGLSDEQVRREMVPSGISLLGLVKHLTRVEFAWFSFSFAGLNVHLPEDALDEGDDADTVLRAYRGAVATSNDIVGPCDDLDRTCASTYLDRDKLSLRWVLVHMIEETARHAGHADILREQLDGSTGR